MAVSFDAASSSSVGNATSLTFAHTCTGTNRGLITGGTVNDMGVTLSCTYAGVSMTVEATRTLPTDGDQVRGFKLEAPASGANNVVFSITGGANRVIAGGAVSATNVDQTDCTTNSNTATGTSSSPSVTVSSINSGELVVGIVGTFNGRTWTQGTNETERWDVNNSGGSGSASSGGYTEPSTGTSVTINPTQSASQEWGIIAISFREAAAAGSTRGMPFASRSTAFNGGRTFRGPIHAPQALAEAA